MQDSPYLAHSSQTTTPLHLIFLLRQFSQARDIRVNLLFINDKRLRNFRFTLSIILKTTTCITKRCTRSLSTNSHQLVLHEGPKKNIYLGSDRRSQMAAKIIPLFRCASRYSHFQGLLQEWIHSYLCSYRT